MEKQRKTIRIIGWVLALCLLPVVLHAQQRDTLGTGFDATDAAFQKRYRYPDAVPFVKGWKENLSVSIFGGMDKLAPRGDADFSMGPLGGVALQWQYAPSHALRASLLAGTFARRVDNELLKRFGLQVDYLFNITSYTKGYNLGRMVEWLLMGGLGYQYTMMDGNGQGAPDLHMGVQLKFHPTSNVDFYIEPRVSLLGDGIDQSSKKNWHRYDVAYGATAGMTFRFKAWKPFGGDNRLEGDKLADNLFVDMAAGAQFQSSKLTSEIGVMKSMGPHYALSVGKWLIPSVALRLSAFKSADTWHQKVIEATETTEGDAYYEMSTYVGGRLEAMFNVMGLFRREEPARFAFSLLAGGELGSIKKENGKTPAKGGYTGFTGGLQLKYKLRDDFSLFVEPRTTMASFSLKTYEVLDGRRVAKRFTDNLFSINVGVEIQRANEEQRTARSLYREEFRPSFFVLAGGGFTNALQVRRYELKRRFQYMGMGGAGYRFSPVHAFRLTADYSPLSIDMKGGVVDYKTASGTADYLLNVGNWLMGYDPERAYDVTFLAGVVGTLRSGASRATSDEELNKRKTLFGFESGLQLAFRINRQFHIFVEPKLRIYGEGLLKQSSIQKRDMMMSLAVGTHYTLPF